MDHKANKPPVRRRDGAGHLDPQYAAELRELSERNAGPDDDPTAFLVEAIRDDDLAEELGEQFVKTATSGEDSAEDTADEVVPEESGGPFVETSSRREFAEGTDESNPQDADREPFPRT